MMHSQRFAIIHARIRAGMSVQDARNYADSLAAGDQLRTAQAAARELGLTAGDVDFALDESTRQHEPDGSGGNFADDSGLDVDDVADLEIGDERVRAVDRGRERGAVHVFGIEPGPRAQQVSPENGFASSADASGYAGCVAADDRCGFDYVVVTNGPIAVFEGPRIRRVRPDAEESDRAA